MIALERARMGDLDEAMKTIEGNKQASNRIAVLVAGAAFLENIDFLDLQLRVKLKMERVQEVFRRILREAEAGLNDPEPGLGKDYYLDQIAASGRSWARTKQRTKPFKKWRVPTGRLGLPLISPRPGFGEGTSMGQPPGPTRSPTERSVRGPSMGSPRLTRGNRFDQSESGLSSMVRLDPLHDEGQARRRSSIVSNRSARSFFRQVWTISSMASASLTCFLGIEGTTEGGA